MAYVPTTWATGDVITAEKLNNIENGIVDSDSIFLINAILNTEELNFTYDKTWADVKNAYKKGKIIILRVDFADMGTEMAYKYAHVYQATEIKANNELKEIQFTIISVNPSHAVQHIFIIDENYPRISVITYPETA